MKSRTRIGRPFLYLGMIVLGLLFAIPFIYTLYSSVLPMRFVNTLTSPANWTLDNFKLFFTNEAYNVPRWFLNTIIMTGVVVLGNMVINPMAGFALAKLNFRGNRLFIGSWSRR